VLLRGGAGRAPWTPIKHLDAGKARMYVFTPGSIQLGAEDGDDDA
jgi:hypothetical protein